MRLRRCVRPTRAGRPGVLAGLLLAMVLLALLGTAALAVPPGAGGSPPRAMADNSGKIKTIGMIAVSLLAMSYKIYKKRHARGGAYRKNRQHDEEVEQLIALKKSYKECCRQLHPDKTPDDKLTIECPSCGKMNLLYAAHCTHCRESISLAATISDYEDKLREIKARLAAGGPAPSG